MLLSYSDFDIFTSVLNHHGSKKKKIIRGNLKIKIKKIRLAKPRRLPILQLTRNNAIT